jgi:hypothetical protein
MGRTGLSRGAGGTPGRSRALRSVALPLLALTTACVIGSSGNGVTIGRIEGPAAVETLVTAGGVRLSVDAARIDEIYLRVNAQFETISCTRTVTTRQPTRSRTPRPPQTGPVTTATSWTEWFQGHETQRSRTRYCTYGSRNLGRSAMLAAGRGGQDSTVHVIPVVKAAPSYPWETLVIQGDTARIGDAGEEYVPHSVYAHLHLMYSQGRLASWLPDAEDADDFVRELAILNATADAWLLLRGGLGGDPHVLLDELLFAREAGRLEAFLLTRRPDAFQDRREAWLSQSPGAEQEYRAWYRTTFDTTP